MPADFCRNPEPAQDLGTAADPALDVFFAATAAAIVATSQPRAFHDITADRIHMPPIGTFKDAAARQIEKQLRDQEKRASLVRAVAAQREPRTLVEPD